MVYFFAIALMNTAGADSCTTSRVASRAFSFSFARTLEPLIFVAIALFSSLTLAINSYPQPAHLLGSQRFGDSLLVLR